MSLIKRLHTQIYTSSPHTLRLHLVF